MGKILSIIVPSYNMEAYLPKCLGSLIVEDKEFFQKLDVIVVNDGSKDRTSEIAHEFEAKYPSVFRVVDKQNGNYGSCVNAGLKLIRGKYVRILDADDAFATDGLMIFLEFLIHSDADMVLTDTVNVDDATGASTSVLGYDFPRDTILSAYDVFSKYFFINMNTITYRAAIFYGGWYRQTEGISYTDTQWCILPLSKVRTVAYLPEIVYRYTTSRVGQTMEETTVARNFWMMARCALDTARQYSAICDTLDVRHRTLMDARVVGFASLPYNRPFKKAGGVKYNIDLVSYDRDLKDASRWIYDRVAGTVGGNHVKCHCAANWRKHSLGGYLRLRVFAMTRDVIDFCLKIYRRV